MRPESSLHRSESALDEAEDALVRALDEMDAARTYIEQATEALDVAMATVEDEGRRGLAAELSDDLEVLMEFRDEVGRAVASVEWLAGFTGRDGDIHEAKGVIKRELEEMEHRE